MTIPMIDFSPQLMTFDGAPITEIGTGPDGRPATFNVTLGRICWNALNNPIASEPPIPFDEHMKRYMLAERIKNANPRCPVNAEEIVLIKTRIAKMYTSSLHAGQAIKLLDPAAAELAEMPKAA